MKSAELHPDLRQVGPGEGRVGDGMGQHMERHAPAALTLPAGDVIGLEGKVSDKMGEQQQPENVHSTLRAGVPALRRFGETAFSPTRRLADTPARCASRHIIIWFLTQTRHPNLSRADL